LHSFFSDVFLTAPLPAETKDEIFSLEVFPIWKWGMSLNLEITGLMPSFTHSVFLFFSMLLSFFARSQQPEQYTYTHFKLTDGLASNIVSNLVQDRDGFIWLATNNGLQRFDGNKFTTFKSNSSQPSSLPSDEVTQVYCDHNKTLWVLTADNRVGTFDTHTFHYREVPLRQWSKEKVSIEKTFIETTDGKLLLHFRKTNKLFQLASSGDAFVPSTTIPFPHNWNINFIFQDWRSQKFFMASDSGFVVYNPKTGNTGYQTTNPEKEPLIAAFGGERFVNYLFIDAAQRFFFEQWTKSRTYPLLKMFDPKTGTRVEYNLQREYGLGYHQIRAMLETKNGKRWVYGLPFLAEYTEAASPLQFLKKDYNKERDLKFNQVYSIYEDRQQNMWLCTDHGVYLFNPDAQLFHNYTLTTPKRFAVEGHAQTALQLPNGEIWIGYRDLGLYRYDAQMHPLALPASLAPLQNMKSVWDIHLHSKTGTIWIGMQGGNLIVYDTFARKARLLVPSPFEQRAITQITEDRNGNLWFGTQGGNIIKWDQKVGATKIEEGFSLVKKTGIIEKLFIDNKGFLWAAAYGEGLLKIDPRGNRVINQLTESSPAGYRLWNNNPKDIVQYNDSLLIVASGALNIVNVNTNLVRPFSNTNGLPTNTVQSVVMDAAERLWLGTMNGLCMADMKKHSFVAYDQRDGLLNENFNVAGAFALHDRRLLFTSYESFLLFDPMNTRKKDTFIKPFVTDFRLMNQPLLVDSLLKLKQIDLSYNKTNVVIEFSALNFTQLNKLDYYYQLQPFDTAWIKSDDRHQAIYTLLPPGNYEFKVKTKNLEGVYSPETTYLRIAVSPPFWKTWWFYLLIAVLVLLVLYRLDKERMKRLVTLQQVRSEIASQLHQDVSTTLSNINVLSQIAKLKAEKDIVRSKELIDEISGKSYNMMVSMDEILWSIDPTNDAMEKTLLRIIEFAKTLETKYDAVIDISVHEKVKQLRLDMKVRHDFFIVCKEALQYLAQYAKNKNIMVDIDLVWSRILVKILSECEEMREDTTGMAALRNSLRTKAEEMDAQLNFETGKRDTSIVLSIPIK
jgi:ligand-binding sensor domain-containing protein/signal transduction histidine kinase